MAEGQNMKSYCNYCDPRHFTINGFCKNCKRMCNAPLYDPKSNITIEEYKKYCKTWDRQRGALVLDAMRRQS